MRAIRVHDKSSPGEPGLGLFLRADDVICCRHGSRRHPGLWEIWVSLSMAAWELMGRPETTRTAVVNDFGDLVIVGGCQ